jgi:oligopeptide/dipeptide ABC transporter ATP-binding protein
LGKEINGLDASRLQHLVADLKAKPNLVRAMNGPWRSRVRWHGGLRTRAYMRNHTVSFDEPDGLGASDTAASGHELLLSALGACILTGFIFQASRRLIKIYAAEISVEGTFGNIKNWAGLEDDRTPGYPEIEAKRDHVLLKGEVPSPLNPPSGCVFHPRCPLATDVCRQMVPEFIEKRPGHWVACHHAV